MCVCVCVCVYIVEWFINDSKSAQYPGRWSKIDEIEGANTDTICTCEHFKTIENKYSSVLFKDFRVRVELC